MLRIDWNSVRGLKDHLARQGFHPESEIFVMTLYRKSDPVRVKIKLEQLQTCLFEIQGDANLTGIFVLDVKSNKPLWSARAAEREEALESIPTTGHANVVVEYKNMNPENRQVWIDIMVAAAQSFVDGDKHDN